jgi:hypothetical protein
MTQPRQRFALISLLLLVLITRALVPAGFMPSADGSAQLTLCPNGMLMPAQDDLSAGAQGTPHHHTDHCPFGAAPFAAPLSETSVFPTLAAAISVVESAPASWVPAARTASAHQPRAPPAPRTV